MCKYTWIVVTMRPERMKFIQHKGQDFNCKTIVLIISVPMNKGKNNISYTEVDPGEDPTMSAIISQRIQIIHFYFWRHFTSLFCVLWLINSAMKVK